MVLDKIKNYHGDREVSDSVSNSVSNLLAQLKNLLELPKKLKIQSQICLRFHEINNEVIYFIKLHFTSFNEVMG